MAGAVSFLMGYVITRETYFFLGILILAATSIALLVRFLINRGLGNRMSKFEILKEKYNCLLNSCYDAVLIHSRNDGRIVRWNQSLTRLSDYSRKEFQQGTFESIIVSDDTQESRDALIRIQNGETVDTDLLWLKKKDGTLLPVAVISAMLPGASGKYGQVQTTISDLSTRNSLQEKLSRRNKMLAAIGIITKLLNSGDDTPGRFKGLVRVVGEVMDSDITSLLFFDQEEEAAVGYQFDSSDSEQIKRAAMEIDENSIYKWVALNKKPLLQEDLSRDKGYSEDVDLYDRGVRSYLILPLVFQDKVMGALGIFNKSLDGVQEDSAEILGHIASHLTLGVNNIQLQREAEKKAQRLKQILVTSNSFRLQVFLDDLLREIVWSIRFSTGFNFVLLSMLNNDTKRVEIKALADNEKGAMKRLIGTTYSWESFHTLMKDEQKISHSYLIDREEEILVKIKELISGNNIQGDKKDGKKRGYALFVPIETRLGKIVGFLLVDDSRELDSRSIEAIQTMEIFANEVAVVIDNQRLFEEAKKKSEELETLNRELQMSKVNLENAKLMLEESNKELAKVNTELREVDKLKAEFLQNVTHELRTPLAPIMVNSEVLLLKKIGDLTPVQEEIVQSIFQSTKRLNSLIDDLLDLTKMESGKLHYQFTLVNPESLVNNSLVETYPFGQEKNITMNKNFNFGDMQIFGDTGRLIQLLTNLLRNAVKFTPEGGRIDLEVLGVGKDRIELKVTDTGVGIPASKLGKIFDRFYQVDGSATRKYKGAGLGLAIVKKIVEAHHGEINVTSKEGEGTAVSVLLPAKRGKIEEEEKLIRSIG